MVFVAAFKGVERFFGVNQIRGNKIRNIFNYPNLESIRPDTIYTRQHETFSRKKKNISYIEIIKHFMDLRNAVAAHANFIQPPRSFMITEDNLFEIHLFLQELIWKKVPFSQDENNE